MQSDPKFYESTSLFVQVDDVVYWKAGKKMVPVKVVLFLVGWRWWGEEITANPGIEQGEYAGDD
jgi:hypothetical protein